MEEQFKKIAAQLPDCQFSFEDQKVTGPQLGSRLLASRYYLTINYKNHRIFVLYELGASNMGYITTTLSTTEIPLFEIKVRSHFSKLFSKDKTTFQVKCSSDSLIHFIYRSIQSCQLDTIAETNQFEPEILNYLEGNQMILKTRHHLEFYDKESALVALINFHQSIIDYSERIISYRR